MANLVNIQDCDKVQLLKKLWQNSKIESLERWDYNDAKEAVKAPINYFKGRLIQTDLTGDVADCSLYVSKCAFGRSADETRLRTKTRDYTNIQKKYDKSEYKNITAVKQLLKHCKECDELRQIIKRLAQLSNQLEIYDKDIGALLQILEKEHIIDARSGNMIKELFQLDEVFVRWLMAIFKIDGISVLDDPKKITEHYYILTSLDPYPSYFYYFPRYDNLMRGGEIEEYKDRIDSQIYAILYKYQPRCGEISYKFVISIFIGFKLFKPNDVMIKLLEDKITSYIESLNYCQQQINYYLQQADKYIEIADQITILGRDKYIDTIKDNMFALMDDNTGRAVIDILSVIEKTNGGMDWLKKDGKTDSKSPIYELIKRNPTLDRYSGWPFCIAMSNLRTAYQNGILFLHKLFLADNGIAWNSFTMEEAQAMENEELITYLRNNLLRPI